MSRRIRAAGPIARQAPGKGGGIGHTGISSVSIPRFLTNGTLLIEQRVVHR
jgi:hypothetical protein